MKPQGDGPSADARVGWVFAGGGARGAYEVGVCDYIFDEIAADLGRMPPLDVIRGRPLARCTPPAWRRGPMIRGRA